MNLNKIIRFTSKYFAVSFCIGVLIFTTKWMLIGDLGSYIIVSVVAYSITLGLEIFKNRKSKIN